MQIVDNAIGAISAVDLFKYVTPQKMKFFIKDSFSKCDQILALTEEILYGKLHFLCTVYDLLTDTKR